MFNLTLPLTERVLRWLGEPRWLWIVAWASSAILAPVVLLALLSATNETERVGSLRDLLVSQAVLAYASGVLLWGVSRLVRKAQEAGPELVRISADGVSAATRQELVTLAMPIAMTAAVAFTNTVGVSARYGPSGAIATLPLLAIALLPIMTFLWTYLELLVGIDRLGRARLALDPFPEDRSLGLRPVGSLAFTGFALVSAAAVPFAIASIQSLFALVVSLLVLFVTVVVFFLSMWRLHRQMVDAKDEYVAAARARYSRAYAPLQAADTIETLESQASVLRAAEGLVDRAESIHEWPIDERIAARVAIIVTGVVTGLIVRFVLIAAGF